MTTLSRCWPDPLVRTMSGRCCEVSLGAESPVLRPEDVSANDRETAALEPLLVTLNEIPRRARVFGVSTRDATNRMRVRPGLLALLESQSLADRRGGETFFDLYDLVNVQFWLGRGLLSMSMLRLWPKMLNSLREPNPVVYQIGFDISCPDPGHPGDCDFTVSLPDGRFYQIPAPVDGGEPLVWIQAERPTQWPRLPSVALEIIDELREIQFIMLPRHVTWDEEDFVRRTGMADCVAFARLLVGRGTQRGLHMRVSNGLLVTPPITVPHYWVDIRVDDTWVPTDPLMLKTLGSQNALDPASWPPCRSPGATFCPIGKQFRPVAGTHRGTPADVTSRSKVVSGLSRS